MLCVDLGESFPTSIYLQKSASIQPRTSLSKFGGKFNSLFIRLLRLGAGRVGVLGGGRRERDGDWRGAAECRRDGGAEEVAAAPAGRV